MIPIYKIIFITFIFSFCFSNNILFAQKTQKTKKEEKEYEYWGDDFFDNINSDSTKKLSNKIPIELDTMPVFKTSAGFFPKLLSNNFFINLIFSNIKWDYVVGTLDISDKFKNLTSIYSANNFKENIEEKEKFSNEDKYGFFDIKDNSSYSIGLIFEYPLLHTKIKPVVGFNSNYFNLYSPIYTNYYINSYDEKIQFKECNILTINNRNIYTSINLVHPIYGAIIYSSISSLEIYYYLQYGLGCQFNLINNLSSYNYILSHTDELRYSNGEIKETILKNQKLNNIANIQYYANIGLGWQFNIQDFNTSVYLEYKYIITPFFKNYNVKQHSLTLNTSFTPYILYSIIRLLF